MQNEELINEIKKLNEAQARNQEILAQLYKNVVQLDGGLSPPANLENDIILRFSDEKEEPVMAKKYRERIKTGVDAAGNPIYEWATGNTKEELHFAIAHLLLGSQLEVPETPPSSGSQEWSKYAQTWFDVYHVHKLRPKTAVKDASIMRNHVKPAFAGMLISAITTEDVQKYLKRKEEYSKSQVRDVMWMMRSVFNSAVEDGIITRNPMVSDRISNTSKRKASERMALSPEQQADIISHIGDLDEPNARRLMAFLMYTCMRPCEIYGLMWKDIDRHKMMISIQRDLVFVNGKACLGDTKTEDSVREIPMPPELSRLIEPFRSTGYVICMPGREGEDNHLTSESVARNIWKRIKSKIDVHGMTPYVGRHTYATNMNRAGVPIRTAMSMMGHTDERMLLRKYTHIDQGDMLNASKLLSGYISSLGSENPLVL